MPRKIKKKKARPLNAQALIEQMKTCKHCKSRSVKPVDPDSEMGELLRHDLNLAGFKGAALFGQCPECKALVSARVPGRTWKEIYGRNFDDVVPTIIETQETTP